MKQLLLLLCIFSTMLTAQSSKHLQFDQPLYTSQSFFAAQASALGVDASRTEWQEIRSVSNKLGVHATYQQLHQGIPVVGGEVVLHMDEKYTVQRANGIAAEAIAVSTAPSYTIDMAQSLVESKADVLHVDDLSLVIVNSHFPKHDGSYRLAYSAKVHEKSDHKTIYLDAITGEEIASYSHICYHSVPGIGESHHYGELTFDVDSLGPEDYLLYDPNRNIRVYNDNDGLSEYRSTSPRFDLVNEDMDEVAIDLFWASAEFYDMMLDKFDWVGLDGDSLALEGIVHVNQGQPFVNAFWNGVRTHYGDGDCHHAPLTTAMIVAHEYMHGVTDYTSDLVYADESGGLNEAMSDIFGKYAEYLMLPDAFNWTVDTTIKRTELGRVFRDMANPKSKGNPEFYGGENWQPGGSVHNNSGVLNYWFYLLSDGKQATNEQGYTYDVQPIGIDAAAEIVWLCQSSYLTSNSRYQDMYEASLIVAEDLYGLGSSELASVTEAWSAVGFDGDAEPIFDIALNNETAFTSCELDGAVDVTLSIFNAGTVDMPRGNFEVVLEDFSNPQEFTVELPFDLMAGQVYMFTIEDAIEVSDIEPASDFGDFRLSLVDDNEDNNITFVFVNNSITQGIDLTIANGQIVKATCDIEPEYELSLRFTNEGCDFAFVDSPAVVNLYDIDQALIGQATFSRLFVFGGSSADVTSTSVEFTALPEEGEEVIVDFDFEDIVEENLDNNQMVLSGLPTELLDEEVETFEDNGVESWNGGQFEVITYQGESMLAATSLRTSNSSRYNLCDDLNFVVEDFQSGQSITEASACLDLRGLEEPQVLFDLVQFRTEEGADLPEYIDFTVFTTVEIEVDGEVQRTFIYGLPEGVKQEQAVDLPVDYVGPLRIKMYSKIGSFSVFPDLDRDVQLIDNIRIEPIIINTEDIAESELYDISPNPARDQITIAGPVDQIPYSIHTLDGRTMARGTLDDRTLSLSSFDKGMYILQLTDNDGVMHSRRFVKL